MVLVKLNKPFKNNHNFEAVMSQSSKGAYLTVANEKLTMD